MPQIQSKQLHGALVTSVHQTVSVSSERLKRRTGGSSMAGSVAAGLLCVAVLTGCGNKGDLYLESEIVAPDELEDAAEKLKKRKKAASE